MTIPIPPYLTGKSAKQAQAFRERMEARREAQKAAQASGTEVQLPQPSEPYEDTTPKGLMGHGSHPIGE